MGDWAWYVWAGSSEGLQPSRCAAYLGNGTSLWSWTWNAPTCGLYAASAAALGSASWRLEKRQSPPLQEGSHRGPRLSRYRPLSPWTCRPWYSRRLGSLCPSTWRPMVYPAGHARPGRVEAPAQERMRRRAGPSRHGRPAARVVLCLRPGHVRNACLATQPFVARLAVHDMDGAARRHGPCRRQGTEQSARMPGECRHLITLITSTCRNGKLVTISPR